MLTPYQQDLVRRFWRIKTLLEQNYAKQELSERGLYLLERCRASAFGEAVDEGLIGEIDERRIYRVAS